MNNRKNYNSIVFLAAFFGLVLVGATPHVSAQKLKLSEPHRLCLPNQESIFIDAKWVIELEKILTENPKSVYTFVKGDYAPGKYKVLDWKIQNAEGNQKATDFLNKEVFCLECYPAAWFNSNLISHEVEATQNEIRIISRIDFGSERAKMFHSAYNYVADNPETCTNKKIDLLFLSYSNARLENNQVFIVTRLPRASIDELLAENAR